MARSTRRRSCSLGAFSNAENVARNTIASTAASRSRKRGGSAMRLRGRALRALPRGGELVTWLIVTYAIAVVICIINDHNDDGGTGGDPLFSDA